MRQYRRKRKVVRPVVIPPMPDDPVGALATWAAATLKVPPGHPLAGQPMGLPDFAVKFLRDGWGAMRVH